MTDENTANSGIDIFRIGAAVVAPTTALLGFLYYFGYTRVDSFYGYFGISNGMLHKSSQDYILDSAHILFAPFLIFALFLIGGLSFHGWLLGWLGRRSPRSWRVRLVVPFGWSIAAVLMAVGAAGLTSMTPGLISPLESAALFSAGLITADRTAKVSGFIRLRRRGRRGRRGRRRNRPAPAVRVATMTPRRGAYSLLIFAVIFWGFSYQAAGQGNAEARNIAASILTRPEVTVFSTRSLQIESGIGVKGTLLKAAGSSAGNEFRYRYDYLYLLTYAEDRWILLPPAWKKGSAVPIVVVPDDPASMRVSIQSGISQS